METGGVEGRGAGSSSITMSTELAPVSPAVPQFRGHFPARLEASGRVLLPAAFKEAFPSVGTLRPYRDEYLNLLNPVAYEAVLRAYERSRPSGVLGPRALKRFAMSSFEVTIDRQHRLVIPPDLRAKVGLETEVVIAGSREAVEIWPATRFAEEEQDDLDEADLFFESFEGL